MECPQCQAVDIRTDVPAISKANVWQKFGWLEVTSMTMESVVTADERMKRAEQQRQVRPPSTDPSLHTCFMCGKSRAQLDGAGVKLILGVYGGICVGCVQLCQDVMEQAGAKTP
jgi:hypothetical protein